MYRLHRLIACFSLCVLLLASPASIAAQDTVELSELSVSTLVERVLEQDPAVINARRAVESARNSRALTRSGVLPNVTLDLTPYSWAQNRVPTGIGGTTQRVRTQSVGAGLRVDQPLPTSGSVSLGLSNRLDINESDGTEFEQAPEATLSLRQPLFVGGQFISDDVFRAGLRNADIGLERSRINRELTTNGTIQQALNLMVQVSSLRRSVEVLEETVAVLRRQLDAAEIDREQGLISDNALLALQVTLNDRRETLFDTELALVETEQSLARVLGVESMNGVRIVEAVPELAIDAGPAAELAADNGEIALQDLAVEQTIQSSLLNDLQDRPNLSVNLRLAPAYPDTRSNPDEIGTSLGDFFESDADLNASVQLALQVPLLTSRERNARERIDELSVLQAEASRSDTERAVLNELQTLLINRDFLLRRVEILETDVRFERQRVANEQTLLEAGATTELRVDEVELDLLSRENELWQVRAELFLNAVGILAARGDELGARLVE